MKLFLLGLFLGYVACDLLNNESKIVYNIKNLKAKKGSSIQVEQTEKKKKERKRLFRKNKKL